MVVLCCIDEKVIQFRVETFDEAFQSRIHIAIRYNDLGINPMSQNLAILNKTNQGNFQIDRKARVQIWKTFLDIAIKDEKGSSGGALQTAIPDDSKKSKNNIDVEAFGANELEYLARRNLNGRQVSIDISLTCGFNPIFEVEVKPPMQSRRGTDQ